MCGCWSQLGWDSPDFGFQFSNLLSKRCGVTKFTFGCYNRLGWHSLDFRCWLQSALFACKEGESMSCGLWSKQSFDHNMLRQRFLHRHSLSRIEGILAEMPCSIPSLHFVCSPMSQYIITWITYGTKHKPLYMFLECVTKSFACEIHIFCQINLINQFSTRTLTFFFLIVLIFMLGTCCS